jgi:uncharacterized protein YgiM (DUF1202 family)
MKRLLTSALLVALSLGSATSFAKTINLYSEPKSDSKVTGTVNTEAGVTIVFTPKSGEWIKVANPANGDVGWVKSSDLGGNNYNMRVISTGDGTHSYSIYQFGGNTGQVSQEQLDKEMQQFEKQQRMMQMQMNHMLNDMFYFPQPVFVPVVMVPVPAKEHKSSIVKTPAPEKSPQTTENKKQ